MGRSKRRMESAGSWMRVASWALGMTLVVTPAIAEDDLLDMSLEELMNIEVTSVSKKAESKNDTAAAITVITAEDIRRGGFTSVPEALRMVPGVHVARIDANRWAITVRGFQNEFANKLLVMMDGRSLYTPVFGGVFWDIQNLTMSDVERIEVIRGPGGAIWGANAVNGVINIITKKAADTQGAHARVRGGTQGGGAEVRYGGEAGSDTHYRVSAKGEYIADYDFEKNYAGKDAWRNVRAGVRTDTQLDENAQLTFHGNYYDVDFSQGQAIVGPPPFFPVTGFSRRHNKASGGNAMLGYDRTLDGGSSLSVTGSYDYRHRRSNSGIDMHLAQLGVQHNVAINDMLSLIWGVDYSLTSAHLRQGASASTFQPTGQTFHLGSTFGQLTVDLLDDTLSISLGTKLSANNWTGFEYQPSGRATYKPVDGHTIWGAVSRAVRTPTMVDRDLVTNISGVGIAGDRNQRSEELLAVEAGYRFYALDWLTAEVAAFWNDYEDISSVNGSIFAPPLVFDNSDELKTWGTEIEVNIRPTDWVRLVATYAFLDFDWDGGLPALPGSSTVTGTSSSHQASLRALFELPGGLEFDVNTYWVDGVRGATPQLQNDNIRQYVRLDLRLGYRPTDWMEIALVGQNVNDARHSEWYDVQRNQTSQIPRAGYAEFTFDF